VLVKYVKEYIIYTTIFLLSTLHTSYFAHLLINTALYHCLKGFLVRASNASAICEGGKHENCMPVW